MIQSSQVRYLVLSPKQKQIEMQIQDKKCDGKQDCCFDGQLRKQLNRQNQKKKIESIISASEKIVPKLSAMKEQDISTLAHAQNKGQIQSETVAPGRQQDMPLSATPKVTPKQPEQVEVVKENSIGIIKEQEKSVQQQHSPSEFEQQQKKTQHPPSKENLVSLQDKTPEASVQD